MTRLWVQFATVLLLVSILSVMIAGIGILFFGWADDTLVATGLPLEIEEKLDALEVQAFDLQNKIDAILDVWFTTESAAKRWALMAATALACATGIVGLAIAASRQISAPISAAGGRIRALAVGDLSDKTLLLVKRTSANEVAQLTNDINTLSGKMRERETRIRKDTAAIAHELRTPLTAMTSTLHAMKDGIIPADTTAIATLLRSTDRLGRIVDDLRTLSLADAGQLSLNRQKHDAAAILHEAMSDMLQQFAQAGIAVVINAQAVEVMVDKHRMVQACQCLLANVIAHADDCTTVTLTAAQVDETVVLSIADNGCGLSPDTEGDEIFTPFYRNKTTTQNSGLGLSVAAAIVREHEGTIRAVHSDEGGATFEIRLAAVG